MRGRCVNSPPYSFGREGELSSPYVYNTVRPRTSLGSIVCEASFGQLWESLVKEAKSKVGSGLPAIMVIRSMHSSMQERLRVLARHIGSSAASATPPLQQRACEAQTGNGIFICAGAAAAFVADNAVITARCSLLTSSVCRLHCSLINAHPNRCGSQCDSLPWTDILSVSEVRIY